jgi:hypothetical protein
MIVVGMAKRIASRFEQKPCRFDRSSCGSGRIDAVFPYHVVAIPLRRNGR